MMDIPADETPVIAEMRRRTAQMPVDERERMRRIITGEADKDLIAKGDVYAIIAAEVLASVSHANSADIQKALRQVQIAVSKKEWAKGPLTAWLGDW